MQPACLFRCLGVTLVRFSPANIKVDAMARPIFVPCTYAGKPAVLDTVSRVFYTCATHTRAREWARELNEGK